MFRIQITPTAGAMLAGIRSKSAREKIINKIEELHTDAGLRGKQLRGELSDYRSLPAAGRYRLVFHVTTADADEEFEGTATIVGTGIRKEGDKNDIYRILSKMMRRGEL